MNAVVSPKIHPSWQKALDSEFKAAYFSELKSFLKNESQSGSSFFPPGQLIFNAFNLTPFEKVKVVILGQDPYHAPGQAHGLAFSVPIGVKKPPSLKNIFKELYEDCGIVQPQHGDLTDWAKQGVLLLNTVLTVRAHEANSHQKQGWEQFTDAVMRQLSLLKDKLIFVLWGGPAKTKAKLIDPTKHHILTSAHPSPLSAYRGFFGCQHFSKINELLINYQKTPIDWRLPVLADGVN